jgi:hypothetical protein
MRDGAIPEARARAAEILWRGTPRPRQPSDATLARLDAAVTWIALRSQLPTPLWARFTMAVAASTAVVAMGVGVWAVRQPRLRDTANARSAVGATQPKQADVTAATWATGEWGLARGAPRRTAIQRRRVARPIAATEGLDSAQRPLRDTLVLELRLIDAARADLDAAPARTLALLERHQRDFPHGQLAAEREFLAVEAFWTLDRRNEARRRATDLQRSYPSSSYAARAARLVQPLNTRP